MPDSDDYDLAPTSAPARRPSRAPAPAATQPPASKQVPYQPKPKVTRDANLEDRVKNFQAPLALLVVGLIVYIGASWVSSRRAVPPPSIDLIATGISVALLVNVPLLSLGILLAASARKIDLHSFSTAALKLCAITVAPAAVDALLTIPLQHVPGGIIIAWLASFMLYFALLGFLFDLDEEDTWYLVKVIFLLRLGIFVSLYYLVSLLVRR